MQRLTQPEIVETENRFISCKNCPYSGKCHSSAYCKKVAINRLATIEDILGDDYDIDRLREIVEADQEKRCVIFRKGYGVVSEYEVDEEGFITRTATGVVTREEYDRLLKGDANG